MQAGFVKQAFFHRMTGLVESRIHVNAVYLSLAKAFHFIAHDILIIGMIKKHTLYGIKMMHFGRTKSWLPDRSQRVSLNVHGVNEWNYF